MAAEEEDEGITPETIAQSIGEAIQFGDPDEATKAVERAANEALDKRAYQAALNNEARRTNQYLEEFKRQNPNLVDDDVSNAMRQRLINMQRDDLVNLGLDEKQIPNSAEEIARFHQHYRATGAKVRPTSALLEEAADVIATKFGIQRRTKDPSEAVARRQQDNARLRGKTPVISRESAPIRDTTPITTQTIVDHTRQLMGAEGSDRDIDNRSSAVEQMRNSRRAMRGTSYAAAHTRRVVEQP
jgi:hypothetical protein